MSNPKSVIELREDLLIVTDSGNNRLLYVNPATCAFQVLSSDNNRQQSWVDGELPTSKFAKPVDICCDKDLMYVVDQNNNALRVIKCERTTE